MDLGDPGLDPNQLAYQQQMMYQNSQYQQSGGQAPLDGLMDADSDDEGGARRRGRPRERKAYIQNDQERRKYFCNRVKAIRAKAETFAKCTGQDILVITFDEEGGAHFWGSPAFERFYNIEGVQDLLYKYLTTQPVPVDNSNMDGTVEAEHLRALLRQKIAIDSTPMGLVMPDFTVTAPPEDWPVGIPFCEPGSLTHDQLLMVLKSMHQIQHHQEIPGRWIPREETQTFGVTRAIPEFGGGQAREPQVLHAQDGGAAAPGHHPEVMQQMHPGAHEDQGEPSPKRMKHD